MNTQKIGLILFLSLLFIACDNTPKEKEKSVADTPQQEAVATTFTLKRDSITSEVRLPAELQAFREVDLYAKVSSYVNKLNVDVGSQVRAGQVLIQLEAPEIASQLNAAKSNLHSREAIYTASNSTYQRLLETSKVEGTISKNDLEQASSKKDADLAQFKAAQATYQEVQTMQSYLQIKAPFDGIITVRNVNIGAFVGGGTQTPLLSIQQQNHLRLAVSVPSAYSGYLKTGDQLTFTVPYIKGETFKANISRMAGALDKTLRSQLVELDIPNADKKLLAGTVADVSISLKSRNNPFVVPKTAVMTTQEGVFVIKVADNKAHHIKVELGLETAENIEIFSDQLAENDTLMVKATEDITNGSTVNQTK
ncbi:efflux RND transporter periplasmic adaptor subunit [Chryseobacterium sp. POL2]|uniref:efflux RND transporter periplasmic adaptor subunit n=1 Tax=Chryseobacterium TaxID=59732 RepID=UPI0013E1954C|nr:MULTISPECIES: efflux RND transporter periplasmic adaptor subunit [Chryseobacterium]MDM1554216.1 efflux RND transporter periplasmic adaptor subunit [Chryseobacterium indologenes]QIG89702.1 efflux RND transporter periplasmic adaptor subunit [Chryseobacterium sp. POL2]